MLNFLYSSLQGIHSHQAHACVLKAIGNCTNLVELR